MLSKLCSAARGISAIRRPAYSWSVERETHHKIPSASEIIDERAIHAALEETASAARNPSAVRDILAKARDKALLRHVRPGEACRSEFIQGLDLKEAATLLNIDPARDGPLARELYDTALGIKKQIYGRRVVLFAPLYLSNHCINGCTYCAFHGTNKEIERCQLSVPEVLREGAAIQRMGHKRTLVLCGESPTYTFEDFLQALTALKALKTPPHGEFRRINVEIPALSVSDMRRLKAVGCVGTYTLFQETYHRESFKKFHPSGPKSDYEHRLQTMDRAQIGGLDDVGIGALLGLYDHRFEVLAMLQHAMHLESKYGAGPHTISIPRIKPATGSSLSYRPPHAVSDDEFRRLVAVIRCAVPYTGMILSTRESAELRKELVNLGVSQMSAASRTDVGAYHKDDGEEAKKGEAADKRPVKEDDEGQFNVADERSVGEVIADLIDHDYTPSWCTACYRKGRTGEAFMAIAKKGEIGNYCGPNALFTLKEYLLDYANDPKDPLQTKLREKGEALIRKGLADIKDPARKQLTEEKLQQIQKGLRDVYF